MSNRTLVDAFVAELDAEYRATRQCLERIPVTLFDFKPHPKSMQMGYLTLLVAEIPLWLTFMIEQGEVDFATYKRFEFTTIEELLDHFEEVFQGARRSLAGVTDDDLGAPFYLKRGGEILFTQPKGEGISSTINHWVHHRGQLTVYMRLNDIAVPSIYGPSADDRVF
jgi:uncharacterized damage-inducible protein DinB